MKICAATGNAGKLRELRRILEAQGHEVVSQKELGITIEPDETGTTFEENALIKAETICKASGLPTIADDSGLCVDALEGAPGGARVEMCACFRALEAEGAVPALCVSGWEVEQAALGRRNYTVLTLEMLARTYPEAELYMAMGSDMLLSFDSWHRWQEILRLARLVVTSRNVGDAPELHAKAKQMDPTGARILFAQVEALPMASSNLRARLAAGEACENELPVLVRRVIRREGLYRADRGESGNHESETGKGACARPVE